MRGKAQDLGCLVRYTGGTEAPSKFRLTLETKDRVIPGSAWTIDEILGVEGRRSEIGQHFPVWINLANSHGPTGPEMLASRMEVEVKSRR
jgi:hypothetical protein